MTDYGYFQEVFDSFNILNSETKLIFYFKKYGNQEKKDLWEEQKARVTNLLENYGILAYRSTTEKT
ncbi:hypothetical protein FCS83_09815 [Oenococcus sp. UCMA 17063]|nr:hypothetical protein [Oenococcus sp. UCMA 17063]